MKFNREFYQELLERIARIEQSEIAPHRVSENPSWWKCKICSMHDLCHVSKQTKEVNCRTCALSTAERDGTWTCGRYNETIPSEAQEKGCPSHVLHPSLVPWEREPLGLEFHAGYNGKINGGPDHPGAISSKEMVRE